MSLLLTGGVDTDGSTPVGEFPAIENLHVGIVTPDLGHQTFPPRTPPSPRARYEPSADFDPSQRRARATGKGKDGFMQDHWLSRRAAVP